ncbi:MAG TPA: LamG-like jellyroll fold domain-containing protein [Anaerolineae bacterium]|nr:LamG-like jellyroll fold domain-containing protein [Anaerolineae bacterium]
MPLETSLQSQITNNKSQITNYTLSFLLLLLTLIAFYFLINTHRYPVLSRIIPLLIIFILFFSPLLQPLAYANELDAIPAPTDLATALNIPTSPSNSSDRRPTSARLQEEINTCDPDGSPLIDSDNDGTPDAAEICLGTDPNYYDSDRDGITDTLEIQGYVYTNTLGTLTTFYTNPLLPDSNGDGISDYMEWPAPYGLTSNIDSDNDGTPDFWDFDNDGDGVLDRDDLEPNNVTSYQASFSLETTLEKSEFPNGYQYIELHVQPQDQSHLSFVTSKFDWPTEFTGTIQDPDRTRDDVSLVPLLKVTTKDRPYFELAEYYGVSHSYLGSGTYALFIPLTPISTGGQITAFSGKIAYDPSTIDEINWTKIELVWNVMMENTEYVDNEPITSNDSIGFYVEDAFRIAGLQVTKVRDTNFALLGTPNTPNDDRDLFQLMHTLEATFMSAHNVTINNLASRYNNPTSTITQTWGLPTTDVAIYTPPSFDRPHHYDELVGYMVEAIPTFLTDNSYPTDGTLASLATVIQTDNGHATLTDAEQLADNHFRINLSNIPVASTRSLNLSHYKYDGSQWRSTDIDEWALAIANRYDDLSTTLTTLQADYPDLTEDQLRLVYIALVRRWMSTLSNIMSFDGVDIMPEEVNDVDIINFLNNPHIDDAIAYIIETNRLAVENAGMVFADTQSFYDYYNEVNQISNTIFYIQSGLELAYNIYYMWSSVALFQANSFASSTHVMIRSWAQWIDDIGQGLLDSTGFVDEGITLGLRVKGSFIPRTKVKLGRYFVSHSNTIGKVIKGLGTALSLAALGYDIYLAWSTYAEFDSLYDYEKDFALAVAITSTVFAVAAFIIGLFAIGAVFLLIFAIAVIIVELIARAIGEELDITATITESVATTFYNVDAYTRILNFEYAGVTSSIVGNGLQVGSTLQLRDTFIGYIEPVRGGESQLSQSDFLGWLEGDASTNITVAERNNSINECQEGYYTNYDGPYYSDAYVCQNQIGLDFTFNEPSIDSYIVLRYKMTAKTIYEECYVREVCENKTETTDLPADLPAEDRWDEVIVYLDVLPGTLDELVTWEIFTTEHTNPSRAINKSDADFDGVNYQTEVRIGTNPNDPDTDNDGILDGYEINLGTELGLDPFLADTDNDGLSDYDELMYNTHPSNYDTDYDGLSDGEEIYHWNGSAWVGGGWFITVAGQSYWTFSDPFLPDADGDRAMDGSEKQNGSGPNGPNDTPAIALIGYDQLISPNSERGIFRASGQTVTADITLANNSAFPLTGTLSLCLPALNNVTFARTGDVIPFTNSSNGCYWWDFSGNPLFFTQEFNATMTAQASAGTLQDTFDLSFPYIDTDGVWQTLTQTLAYYQDNTPPTIQLTDPYTGTILNGDFYVMGGFSQDEHSWIDRVEVTVPAGTYTATGATPWAYTWDLPDQGVVSVSAIAYDAVGNASTPASINVTVDSLPPVITSNYPQNTTIAPGQAYSSTIPISGTVTDNYSGLSVIQLRPNNQPWRTIFVTDTLPLSTDWEGIWNLPNNSVSAQGEHLFQLRAYDDYGNIGYFSQTLFIDLLPPTAELIDRQFTSANPPQVAAGTPFTITGIANDAGNNPQVPGPVDLQGNLDSIDDATVWLQPSGINDGDNGITVSWIGDFNGDRLSDLAIGLPAVGNGTGKVYIVRGAPGGWAIPALNEYEFLAEHGPGYIGASGAGIGSVIEPISDFDGDGAEDLIIGDPANNHFYLIYGTRADLGRNQSLTGPKTGYWTRVVVTDGSTFTVNDPDSIAYAGDVNQDGLADFLVKATTATGNRIYLIAGNTSGYGQTIANSEAAAMLNTTATNVSLAGVGDVTGDFIDDFAIALDGTVYLFAGGGGWTRFGRNTLDTTAAIATFTSSDLSPTIHATGDMNNDSIGDFIYDNGSTPTVVFGGSYATQPLSGFPSALSGFVAAVGDVNKDGQGDLLIGNADGDAYLIHGNDLTNIAATIANVDSAASAFSTGAADLAGDASADLLLVPSATAQAFAPLQQARPASVSGNALPQSPMVFSVNNSSLAKTKTVGNWATTVHNANAIPVAYWDFEEGTGLTAADAVTPAHDGTLTNGTLWTTDSAPLLTTNHYAVQFDGVDDRVDFPNSIDINTATGYSQRTVSLWVKPTSPLTTTTPQILWEEGGAGNGLNIYIYNGAVYGGAWSDTNSWPGTWISSTLIEEGQWNRLTLVLNSSSTTGPEADALRFYVNGRLIDSQPGAQLATHAAAIAIGDLRGDTRFHTGNIVGTGGYPFTGLIDELYVYNDIVIPEAYVGTSTDSDYSSIQEAIDGGAPRILVEPGIYVEAITLTNNVIVAGSGADRTYLQAPTTGNHNAIVTIDGVTGSAVTNLSLIGDGTITGADVRNGAANINMSRLIIRDTGTALALDGATTDLDLRNNTIVLNDNGLIATNCASIDVRNTIFAYHTETALEYQGCAALKRHQYNLYWGNGTDISPNETDGSEIFSNPLFTSIGQNDFSVLLESPVIDAGSPGDPAPVGSGRFIDIGHREQTGTGFAAAKEYCATCDNDGLVWGIDAFGRIQDAVDAAQDSLVALRSDTPVRFSVGVGPGVYTESVVISTSLILLGSGADQTTIIGNGGPAVTAQNSAYSTISGFTLTGDGAKPIGVALRTGHSYSVTYNLIINNHTGISVTKRTSGDANFNTIVSNTVGAHAYYQYNWLSLENNIIAHNGTGLQADGPGYFGSDGTAAIFTYNNLLYNTLNYTNVVPSYYDIIGVDPLLTGPYAQLTANSPALDVASPGSAVPAGGGFKADLGWDELIGSPISVLMGQADLSVATKNIGVGEVEYAIVPVADPNSPISSTLPSSWNLATLATPDANFTYWHTNYTAATTGTHRIYSRATDSVGNGELDSDVWYEGAFVAVDGSTIPVVTLNVVNYGPYASNAMVRLEGAVTDYVGNSLDIEDIYFTVEGQRIPAQWAVNSWQPDGVTPRDFYAIYFNNDFSPQNLDYQAFATDSTGNTGSSAIVTSYTGANYRNHYESRPPVIVNEYIIQDQQLPVPPYNVILSGTVDINSYFNYDSTKWPERGSGISGYELSFDGGQTWDNNVSTFTSMETNGGFYYQWEVPDGWDATTFAVLVRAFDYSGFVGTGYFTMTIDTAIRPTYLPLFYESDYPIESHLDKSETITVSWTAPTDGSGYAVTKVLSGQTNGVGVPSFNKYTTSGSMTTGEVSDWYYHIGSGDEAGNLVYDTIGPWKSGQVYDVPWGGALQSLNFSIDGMMDIAHNEWLTATELLGEDERPETTQKLYATWDAYSTFLAWQGAAWDEDGELWLYWDVIDGAGTNQPVSGTVALPFAADHAVRVTDSENIANKSWRYDGANWVNGRFLETQQNVLFAETEIQLGIGNTATFNHYRLLAFATNDVGDIWTAFPTNNTLDGNFTQYYEWEIVGGDYNTSLLSLPTASQLPFVDMNTTSNPPTQDTVSSDNIIEYVATLENVSERAANSLNLKLSASAGLSYQSVTGATCTACTATDSWTLSIPTLASGATHLITITAQLDSDLTGITTITNTMQLTTTLPLPVINVITHTVDIVAPQTTINTNPANVVATGLTELIGTADDGFGTGVALVEISADNNIWTPVTGTQEWSTELNVPASLAPQATFDLYVRATDYHGNRSNSMMTFNIDTDAPLITPTVPVLITGTLVATIKGMAYDLVPSGAAVAKVEAQIDTDTAAWLPVSLNTALDGGKQSWVFSWPLPTDDYQNHTLRFRATDYGGNVTTTGWYTTRVDIVPPVLNVTTYDNLQYDNLTEQVLAGTVTDNAGVQSVTIQAYPAFNSGNATVEVATLNGTSWSYTPTLPVGYYYLLITAKDAVGQETVSLPYFLKILRTDPIAHWTFDEGNGTTAIDITGNNHTGTLLGTPTYATSTPSRFSSGYSLELDSSDDEVSVPGHVDLNLANQLPDRTVTAWFNTNDKDGDFQLIYEQGAGVNGLNIYLYQGALYAGAWSNVNNWSGSWISTTAISSNQWHHVALVISATTTLEPNAIELYLDGNLVGQAEGTRISRHTGNVTIGNTGENTNFHTGINSAVKYPFLGRLDDIRIYSRGLAATEIYGLTGQLTFNGQLSSDKADFTLLWNDAAYASYAVWSSSSPYSGYTEFITTTTTSSTTSTPVMNSYYELYGVDTGPVLAAPNRVGVFHMPIVGGSP